MMYTSKCTILDNCDSDLPQLHLHMYNQCMAYFLHHTTGAHNRELVHSCTRCVCAATFIQTVFNLYVDHHLSPYMYAVPCS